MPLPDKEMVAKSVLSNKCMIDKQTPCFSSILPRLQFEDLLLCKGWLHCTSFPSGLWASCYYVHVYFILATHAQGQILFCVLSVVSKLRVITI